MQQLLVSKPLLAICVFAICVLVFSAGSANAVEASPAVCDAYAKDMGNRATRGGPSVGRGAARGAILGAIIGDSRRSARKGAVIGALAGGARKARARREAYDRSYADCMTGRVKF